MWKRLRTEAGEFTLPRHDYLTRIKGQPIVIIDRLRRVEVVRDDLLT
jgi:hypothetical protein